MTSLPDLPYVKITLAPTERAPRREILLEGDDVGYRISSTDLPGCVKIFKGKLTRVYPLASVEEIEVNL